jgi:hypothetical protein
MMAPVDVISLLEGINTSTPVPGRTWHDLVLSLVGLPPYLLVGLTTLLPLGFFKHYLLLSARHRRLALSSSTLLECSASLYAGLRRP